jgi:hypothetical protein
MVVHGELDPLKLVQLLFLWSLSLSPPTPA